MKANLPLLELNKNVLDKDKPRLCYLNFGNEWQSYLDRFVSNFQDKFASMAYCHLYMTANLTLLELNKKCGV